MRINSPGLTKLREDGIERLLQVIFLDLFVEVVDVDSVVWRSRLHYGALKGKVISEK